MTKFVDRWADACDDLSEGELLSKRFKDIDDENQVTLLTSKSAGSCDANGAAVSRLKQ